MAKINGNDLKHALEIESRAQITPEKLNKISWALEHLKTEIDQIKNSLNKYSSVLYEMKQIEEVKEHLSPVAILARKKYRELLTALHEKISELKEKY